MPNANTTTVLVVGASGRSGGFAAAELARRGVVVRALVRDEAAADRARSNGASDIAFGDLRDPPSLAAALDGVDGVYHVGAPFTADETAMGLAMVAAAKAAGIRKFVFSSVIHPANGLANHASKLGVEEALLRANLDFTILYPATLFQNLTGAWPVIAATGLYAEPVAKAVRLARVDYRDVAEVAAEALTGDRLSYGSFELAADGMPDRTEIAAMMSEALGRPVAVTEPSFATWAAAARLPFDARQLAELEQVYRAYDVFGSAGNSLTLRAILGRPPRTLRQFFQDLAAEAPQPH